MTEAGAIVTISSVSGREIDFAAGPYGAAKAAVLHYTQTLAYRLAGRVRADVVSPGNVYFPGGVWENIEANDPRSRRPRAGAEPDRADGAPRGGRSGGDVPGTNLVVDGALTCGVQL